MLDGVDRSRINIEVILTFDEGNRETRGMEKESDRGAGYAFPKARNDSSRNEDIFGAHI